MKNHTDLINFIAATIKANTYLEIGVYNPENNFNKILSPLKMSVDPDPNAGAKCRMTSDDFFHYAIGAGHRFDLIFIDGLHHADQVKRDIINAWAVLNPGGVIVIHDCNPATEDITKVPRATKVWCGDVYKTVCDITTEKFTVDFDHGCCVIRKPIFEAAENKNFAPALEFAGLDYTWKEFHENRYSLLQLRSVTATLNIIESWT